MNVALSFCTLTLALSACAGAGAKLADVAANCAPSSDALRSAIDEALKADDPAAVAKRLALVHGSSFVFCALTEVVDELSRPGASDADGGARLAKAKAARDAVGTTIEASK